MKIMDQKQLFASHYKKEPERIYFCPGRVNLIGEHIDYNGGLVMPCAINHGTYLLISFNNDNLFRVGSADFDEYLEIPVGNDYIKNGDTWHNYPLGIIKSFADKGIALKGLDMFFVGNIPIGSGLSSSASIGIVTAFAINHLFKTNLSKLELVKLVKAVENDFIGVSCGIMDQYAVTFGAKEKALLINCENLEHEIVECDFGDCTMAIINTNKHRTLAESKYNERVRECQAVLVAFQQQLAINNLCDINPKIFENYSHLVQDRVILKRARHVIEENQRVKMAASALATHNLTDFGKLLYASHYSLKELYEVSGYELDSVVDYCKTNPDVLGARMTGAGFGGCAIALVKTSGYDQFTKGLTRFYKDRIGYEPSVYQSSIANGVEEIENCVTNQIFPV